MKTRLNIKRIIVATVIALLSLLLVVYLFLPTISIFYTGSLIFIAFVVGVVALTIWLALNDVSMSTTPTYESPNAPRKVSLNYKGDKKTKVSRIVALVAAGILALSILLGIISAPIFRSKEYYNILGKDMTEVDFVQSTPEVTADNLTELINIDSSLAEKKATTLFGEIKGFGSEYQLGMFTDQIVNGKFVTVAPIEYNGLFKYFANAQEGTPGYVIVDKQNFTSQTGSEIVMDKNYKYMTSSYFGTDLCRHVYFSGYANYDITVGGFELDDNGNAYWIINVYQNTIYPYGGPQITKVLLVNPTNGHIDEYAVDSVPSWVDNIQDSDIVVNRINQYGMYEKGWLNSVFAQTGVVTSTEGSRHMVVDNQLYLFTGMTSVGADESISHIVLVNKRTLEATLYDVSGATEFVAMSSAEGKLQNYGYTATFPIPVNINGVPTYFIPLKDELGLVKHYTFVRVDNHTIIGAGETVQSAYSNYLTLVSGDNTDKLETVTGNVIRREIVDNMVYLLMPNGNTYYMSGANNLSIYLTRDGDNVTLRVSGSQIIDFTNNTLAGM